MTCTRNSRNHPLIFTSCLCFASFPLSFFLHTHMCACYLFFLKCFRLDWTYYVLLPLNMSVFTYWEQRCFLIYPDFGNCQEMKHCSITILCVKVEPTLHSENKLDYNMTFYPHYVIGFDWLFKMCLWESLALSFSSWEWPCPVLKGWEVLCFVPFPGGVVNNWYYFCFH